MNIAIITPMKGRREFVPIIERILANQTYQNFKHYVCSEDGNPNIHNSIWIPDTSKTHYIGSKRNQLIDFCKSNHELIVHMDSDDYYSPFFLEKTVQLYNDKKIISHSSKRMVFYDLLTNKYETFVTRNSWGASLSYLSSSAPVFPTDKERGEERVAIRSLIELGKYTETDILFEDILVILHGNNCSTGKGKRDQPTILDNIGYLENFVKDPYIINKYQNFKTL